MDENNLSSIGEYEGNEVKIDIDQNEFNLSNILIEDYKRKMLNIDTEERLKPASRCCIYRVPTNLRKVNQEAYTPQFVSIGPFHYGKAEFVDMEKQKIRYKKNFGNRFEITEDKWQGLINLIKQKEQDIRDCYAESTSHFQSHEFIIMILYDAIFIIELLLKSSEGGENEFLIINPRLRAGIWLDLQLLENQLPFFVLKELYELALDNRTGETPFVALTSDFFKVQSNTEEFKHFVDLRRKVLVINLPDPEIGQIDDLASAVKLHESGVKFKKIDDDNNLLNIKFQDQGFMPCFKKHELQIPHTTIADQTESLFRNTMALEQCHYPLHTHICNYIDLMDALINSEKDVDFLVEKGIITNFIGDHAAIAQMFNKLCLQITPSESTCYKDTVQALKTHHGRWWNRTKATLMSVYFSNLWRGTGTVAAIILLVLTFLQTIYSMGL